MSRDYDNAPTDPHHGGKIWNRDVERPIPVELMRRIWANLYYDEAEAGNTFQATLNDVVDWLKKHEAAR